jgi:GH18 family chitinase
MPVWTRLVELLTRLETTPEKILLGIPAYARRLQVPTDVKTFGEIYDGLIEERRTINWQTLHSWNGYEWESGNRIQDKVDLAKNRGLGGIFFWEIGQDKITPSHPRGVLLEAAAIAAARNHTVAAGRSSNNEL